MANKNLTLATEKYVDDLINNCSPSIITTSDTAKTLSIPDSSESVIRGLTGYGESTQDGTPTPDSPVEIVSVENPVISVYGKNLIPYPFTYATFEHNGITFTDNKDGTITLNGQNNGSAISNYNLFQSADKLSFLKPNTDYYLSCNLDNIIRSLRTVKSDGTYKYYTYGNVNFSPDETPDRLFIQIKTTDTTTYDNTVVKLQLELGTTVTPYEPYIEPQTVTVPYTFRGLKNSNAGWFVRDEVVVDVKSQTVKIIKRLLERVIDGTENWNGSTSGSKYLITGDKAKGTGNVISNRFKRGYDEGRVPGEISSTVTNSTVFVMYTEDITVSDFKSMLAEWYASGNPMVMVYVLETPTETDITATEAGQVLLKLYTNYPNTSVISDIDLDITYKADTKNYIDNKIATLTALTLEG